MNVRQVIASLREILPTLLALALLVGGAIAAIWLLPGRTAAVVLGVGVAALLTYFVLLRMQLVTQVALLWLSIGITADAAYARVNDLAPVTIAGVLVRLVESLIKLGDILIRGFGLLVIDPRVRPAPVANEFVWAFILALIVFLGFNLMRGTQR